MKILTSIFAMLTSISQVMASNCDQFDGTYEKTCVTKIRRTTSDGVDGAFSGFPKSLLIIKADSNCAAIRVNDPRYNGSMAPLYISEIKESPNSMTDIRQRAHSPRISENEISAKYVLKHDGHTFIEKSKERIEFSIKRTSEDTVSIEMTNHTVYFGLLPALATASCTLRKIENPDQIRSAIVF